MEETDVVAPAAAAAPVQAKGSPKKKANKSKNKKPANHPKYSDMIKAAITSLKEHGGSSRQAILKYIMANYNVGKDEKIINSHLKMALRAGAKNGNLKQSKGVGASGSFKLGSKEEAKAKKVKSPKNAENAKAKKPKSPAKPKKSPVKKAPAAKKPAATKKPKSPKKAAAAKPKAAKPAAEKPKKPKSAQKKAAPKKTGKKAAAKKEK